MEAFKLEKTIWDDSDFDVMGWHDATIWSTVANPDEFEFLVDLDYIFKWVQPTEGETYFKFWVAPVTMIFENAHNVSVEIESEQGTIEVANFHRENPRLTLNGKLTQYTYRFECQEGNVSLTATGFKMYVRRAPQLLQYQSFGLKERKGVRFGRASDVT